MTRPHEAHFTGLHVAQEARRAGCEFAADREFSWKDGDRFMAGIDRLTSAGAPDPRVAPQMTLLELRELRFTLPMPPSCNALYGVGKNGQKFLLPEQRQFRSAVIGIVRGVMRRAEQRQPLAGRIEITTTYFFNDRRRTDIRNRIKALDDALEHAGAFANDCQIDAGHDYRIIAVGEERCEVELREIAA